MASSDSSSRKFEAFLLGKTVRCETLADAIVIRFADHALTSRGECPYDSPTLRKIAGIVRHYGHADVAERLVAMAKA